MKTPVRSAFCALLFSLSVLSPVPARALERPQAGKSPVVGEKAPDFVLDSEAGKPTSLREFRGKWVVLYFYPKDFTSGCTIEAHNFQRDLKQYERKNTVILGVSGQSAASHKQFCAREGLSFKLLADTKHEVSSVYQSTLGWGALSLSARHTFLIDPDGVLARTFLDVKPARHSEEVLAALDELQKIRSKK